MGPLRLQYFGKEKEKQSEEKDFFGTYTDPRQHTKISIFYTT